MQIFIRDLRGKTHTLDVEQSTTILEIMAVIEKRCDWPIPFQKFGNIRRFPNWSVDATVEQCGITKECTIHAYSSACPQVFVCWQGQWLRSKDYPGQFHNFWTDLTRANVFKRKYGESTSSYERSESTLENLVAYHLQKVVAQYLLLETAEVSLSTFSQPTQMLDCNVLLSSIESRYAFIAHLRPAVVPSSLLPPNSDETAA